MRVCFLLALLPWCFTTHVNASAKTTACVFTSHSLALKSTHVRHSLSTWLGLHTSFPAFPSVHIDSYGDNTKQGPNPPPQHVVPCLPGCSPLMLCTRLTAVATVCGVHFFTSNVAVQGVNIPGVSNGCARSFVQVPVGPSSVHSIATDHGFKAQSIPIPVHERLPRGAFSLC